MSEQIHVAVLMGGWSNERPVSLMSGNGVADALEKGKEVVTASGIIAKINKIDGGVVTLEVANGTFIRVVKSAISKEMTEAFAAKA